MIDDEALQREIDRENTPAESARLMEELRHEPDARARYDELARLSRALDSLPPADPPKGLLESVMRAVRALAHRAAPREGAWASWRAALGRRPALGLGLSFATGVLIAFVVSGLSEPGRVPGAGEAAATALSRERLATRAADRVTLEADGARAVAIVERTGDRVHLKVRVESGAPLSLVATWDARGLHPLGFERAEAPADAVAIRPDSWRIDGATGGEYALVLEAVGGAAPVLSLRLERGTTVVEKQLQIAEAPLN